MAREEKREGRRDFLKAAAGGIIGLVVGAAIGSQAFPRTVVETKTEVKTETKTVERTVTQTVTVTPSEALPAWEYGRFVFVPNRGENTLSVIDTKTDEVIKTIVTGSGPSLSGMTPDGKKLYVSNRGGVDIAVVDTVNLKVIKTITVGERPNHPVVSPNGRYVAANHDRDNKTVIIDTTTDTIVKTLELPAEKAMMHPGWTWDSKYLFAQDFIKNVVFVIEAPRFEIVKTLQMESRPHYFVATRDNKEVWIVLEGKGDIPPAVAILDLSTMSIVDKITISVPPGEPVEGHHGVFSSDGKYFYYANRGPPPHFGGRSLFVIETSTRRVIKRIEVGNGAGHPYLSPDGRYIFVGCYNDNTVAVIDTKTHEKIKEIKAGDGKNSGHVAFTLDGKKAYINNNKDHAVYVVDVERLEVIKKIPTGKAADYVVNVYRNILEMWWK
ncbi:MAG: cytochrome D1 domain-containing protein [Pyrobaculum sp.]